MWRYLQSRGPELFPSTAVRVLEMAPFKPLSARFLKAPSVRYVSADLNSASAMIRADITRLPFSDDTFDAIYCSHVLEHIPDDSAAMRELRRVLRVGGWAILQVPITPALPRTYEDPSVQLPDDRERAFGQFDHVRAYGLDYKVRLESAGFSVSVDRYAQGLSPAEAFRLGIDPTEDIYFCGKLTERVTE